VRKHLHVSLLIWSLHLRWTRQKRLHVPPRNQLRGLFAVPAGSLERAPGGAYGPFFRRRVQTGAFAALHEEDFPYPHPSLPPTISP
jgi:hypothetical protein